MGKTIVNIISALWGMLLYGLFHKWIETYIYGKFTSFSVGIYEVFNNSQLFCIITSVLLIMGTLYLACCRAEDKFYSWWKLFFEVFAIEVLWLAERDWLTPSSGFPPLPLFHFLAILICVNTVSDIVKHLNNTRQKRIVNRGDGFTIDNIQEVSLDSVRQLYADKLLERLGNTNNQSDSYAIVVYGSWGSGKTVFLNYLEEKLRENDEEVLVFNPWNCQGTKSIIVDFFSLLSDVLKKYDSSLEKPIIQYSKLLESLDAPKILSFMSEQVFGRQEGISELKSHIVDSLSKNQKPVYVLIDDLDRMEAEEILSVVRLIRNTANFPYLKFIVACDRDYVENKLKGIGVELKYLEKIFMSDIYLPSIYAHCPYMEACRLDLELMTHDNFVYNFLETINDENAEIIDAALGNFRQARRFARGLALDWEFARSNNVGRQCDILFKDYFWIELLKFTRLSLYKELESNPTKFFDVRKNHKYKIQMYVLKKKSEEPIGNLEIQILEQIFPYDNFSKITFMSVALIENYDKYFSFGKAIGHISQSDYVDLLHTQENGDVVGKVSSMEQGEIRSLHQLVLMTDVTKLNNLKSKRGYIRIIFALGYRLKQDFLTKLIEEKLVPLLKDNTDSDKLKSYLVEELTLENHQYPRLIMSSSICNALLFHLKENNFNYIADVNLKNIIKRNFKKMVENHDCDAADVLKDNTVLNRLVKASVVCYPLKDGEDLFISNEYECVISDEMISYFKMHKSRDVQAIKNFEEIIVDDEMDNSELGELQQTLSVEIDQLFGEKFNYRRFKEECFAAE